MSCHRLAIWLADMLDVSCQTVGVLEDMTCHEFLEVSGHGMTRVAWIERAEVDVACQRGEIVVRVDLVMACHPDLDEVGHSVGMA